MRIRILLLAFLTGSLLAIPAVADATVAADQAIGVVISAVR